MEDDIKTSTYLKVALLIFLIPIIVIFILFNGEEISNKFEEMTHTNKLKNTEITQQNYKEIYDIVNESSKITLQEKKNFNENYLIFGKKIIGYKVKDVLKEIE